MKIKSNKSLEPDISEAISKIKHFGGDRVKFIVLYGSAAKRQNTNLSDIDIAVFHSGEVLYYSDYTEIFDTFMKTIREFGDFKPRLELYYSNMGV